jgi:hypothetical protein
VRTKKPRDLADAPEASEYNHINEPAKSLLSHAPNSWIRCSMLKSSRFYSPAINVTSTECVSSAVPETVQEPMRNEVMVQCGSGATASDASDVPCG